MSNKHEATYHGGEYTPTTDEIKHAWYRSETADNPFDQRDAIKAEFDRWLTTVRAEAKAEAWDACARSIVYEDGTPVEIATNTNPYK